MAKREKEREDKKEEPIALNQWLEEVYKTSLFTEKELLEIYELHRYKGFDRSLVLFQLKDLVITPRLAVEVIIVCALQGPKRASKTILTTGRTIAQLGIPASGQKGTKTISCARISAATADLAAYYLKLFKVQPRIANHPCPSWLQFPTAGSIKLPAEIRDLHIDFSKKFSILIGGVFNNQIYDQMIINAYLDPKLKLFDN